MPSAATAAASAADEPAAIAASTADERIGAGAHVDERHTRVGPKLNSRTDDGPVLGSTVELLIAPAGAAGLRDPDLGEEFVLAQGCLEEAREEVIGADDPLAVRTLGHD